MDQGQLTQDEVRQLNDLAGYLSYKPSWIIRKARARREKKVCWFTGNQEGKTSGVAHEIVTGILGMHPIPECNLRPGDTIRTIRCCSQTLPNDPEGGEVKNTQYPAIKRYLPKFLIKSDITIRKPVITLKDPQGGADIFIEFVSFNQVVQGTAGVQRWLVWIDESCSKEFYEEQIPRLFAANGRLIYTLTPAEFIGWEYGDLFQRASVYIRTPEICRWIEERHGKRVQPVEYNPDGDDLCVLQAATDDNPFFQEVVDKINEREGGELTVKKYLDQRFEGIDQDIVDIRRYGIFRQVTGQVHKEFTPDVHIIRWDKYFEDGKIPYTWLHVRGCDYHERNNWAVPFMALSDRNECFVYDEYSPSPEKNVTKEICREIAHRSKDYRYGLNLIDPLAAKNNPDSGSNTVEEMNRVFSVLKSEGLGAGGYWQTWDTKATVGRERVKERLRNARLCGRPFNNRIVKDGKESWLPTIWFLETCRETISSFKNWSWEEWADRDQLLIKDVKDKAQQKWSHYPIAIECVMKHPGFHPRHYYSGQMVPEHKGGHRTYFGARA